MPIRPPTHRAAGQARRAALLEAAVEVLAEKGVGGATHRAIAKQADMPLSTTSYFFASIDELIGEAMRIVAERVIAQLDDLVHDVTDGSTSVEDAVERYVALASAANTAEVSAQFEIYLQSAHRPELQSVAHQMMAGFERAGEAALRAAGANRPAEGARVLSALIDGFALHRVAWPRGEADRRALQEGLWVLLRSYLPESQLLAPSQAAAS